MTSQALTGGDATEPFEIRNEVKQGCEMAKVLFILFFTCMLAHAVQDLASGVCTRYRLDGSVFDLRRLAAKTKSLFDLRQEALFADDCALVTHEDSDLQLVLLSISKTQVITIDNTQLANVESFKYLGSIISQDDTLNREVDTHIGKASQAIGRLRNRVLSHHNVRQSTKLIVYNTGASSHHSSMDVNLGHCTLKS